MHQLVAELSPAKGNRGTHQVLVIHRRLDFSCILSVLERTYDSPINTKIRRTALDPLVKRKVEISALD